MNATATIFALAIASNHQPQYNFKFALQYLRAYGELSAAPIYLIPCRDGIGEDYWNSAYLLYSPLDVDELMSRLKALEQQSGRVRPSHQISLDIDLIAWGKSLAKMEFNPKKLPLAVDVKIPLSQLWQHPSLLDLSQNVEYPLIELV